MVVCRKYRRVSNELLLCAMFQVCWVFHCVCWVGGVLEAFGQILLLPYLVFFSPYKSSRAFF